jgi:hypothetical protein
MARIVVLRGSKSAGFEHAPKTCQRHHVIRVAPTATIWQRRRSDGSEKEGAPYEAQCREEVQGEARRYEEAQRSQEGRGQKEKCQEGRRQEEHSKEERPEEEHRTEGRAEEEPGEKERS